MFSNERFSAEMMMTCVILLFVPMMRIERNILKVILGPVQREDSCWRVRTNAELEDLVAQSKLIGEIKAHWLSHFERMGKEWNVKKVFEFARWTKTSTLLQVFVEADQWEL